MNSGNAMPRWCNAEVVPTLPLLAPRRAGAPNTVSLELPSKNFFLRLCKKKLHASELARVPALARLGALGVPAPGAPVLASKLLSPNSRSDTATRSHANRGKHTRARRKQGRQSPRNKRCRVGPQTKTHAQLSRLHLTSPVPRYFLGALVKRAKLEGSD